MVSKRIVRYRIHFDKIRKKKLSITAVENLLVSNSTDSTISLQDPIIVENRYHSISSAFEIGSDGGAASTSSVFEVGSANGGETKDSELPDLEPLSAVKPGAKSQMNGDHYNYLKMVVQLTETKNTLTEKDDKKPFLKSIIAHCNALQTAGLFEKDAVNPDVTPTEHRRKNALKQLGNAMWSVGVGNAATLAKNVAMSEKKTAEEKRKDMAKLLTNLWNSSSTGDKPDQAQTRKTFDDAKSMCVSADREDGRRSSCC